MEAFAASGFTGAAFLAAGLASVLASVLVCVFATAGFGVLLVEGFVAATDFAGAFASASLVADADGLLVAGFTAAGFAEAVLAGDFAAARFALADFAASGLATGLAGAALAAAGFADGDLAGDDLELAGFADAALEAGVRDVVLRRVVGFAAALTAGFFGAPSLVSSVICVTPILSDMPPTSLPEGPARWEILQTAKRTYCAFVRCGWFLQEFQVFSVKARSRKDK
ncbi:hypothetical protein [Roseibium aggregatum]|uniref:hypothetical protein n=1 Tax=Roseibium aggregatum TaxID=187304 RepID=UPI00111511E0|nr:hypothetical protein [Roseibium aggregatum]UFI02349.1 hypothetical protein ST40_020375 [Roseibium aggregatum]